ncbi:feruloyl esterase-like protein [Lenzites betulinus]|nr:feruloyl esterase-like protein [Lenzites betulinus]
MVAFVATFALLVANAAVALGEATVGGSKAACTHFSPSNIPDVSLTATTYFPANARVDISNIFSSINTTDLPAFCRVELKITTNATAGSFAITEVWLPDSWNSRTLTIGNGGFGGGVTNAIVDWGWRAVHLSVVAGKEITAQYYKTAAKKDYYLGCSTGKLKEIQFFPDSFDGVVIGSPANWMSHLQAWSIHMSLNVLPTTSSRFMTPDIWMNVIGPEVMKQCDALDGLTDGIINDPRACSFDPETLTCRPGQNTSTCLTGDQIGALHRIYADYYEANQTYVFGGYYPGGENVYPFGLVGASPFALPADWYRFFVLNDTQFTQEDYNASLIQIAEQINPGQSDAIDPNLTAFATGPRHGKVLHYVGWADQLISPGNSLHYYETVHEFTQANSSLDIDDFYRLFTVPGMNHWLMPFYCCAGGQAANAFGGVSQPVPLSDDPQHNILSAMVRWVEEGVAPSTLVGVKYKNDVKANGVEFTRPMCKYPAMVRFRGGNPNSASSFFCA